MSTRIDPARTLLACLSDQASDPDGRALVFVRPNTPAETVSRLEFRLRVDGYAGRLSQLGVGRRDVVVVAHTDGLDPVYAFWACLRIGAIPSIFPSSTERLDPAALRENVAVLARQSGARLVLAAEQVLPVLPEIHGCVTSSFERLREPAPTLPPAFDATPDDVAFLQHSSGTTGLQKGVMLSHRAVLNQLASYSDALGLQASDVVVSWLPLYHDMGLIAGCLLPLVQGLPLVLMSPFDWVKRPALLLRAIHEHGGTLCWLPNFAYVHCARRVLDREIEGVRLSGMRAFINCSEPVLDSSHRAFLERFAPFGIRKEQLGVSYAMAENVFAVTQTPIGSVPRVDTVDRETMSREGRAVPVAGGTPEAATFVSCGAPVPGVHVRVDGGRPDRELGELEVSSHCLMTGYHRRPELNEEAFHDGWYRTGDLGYVADGEVFVVGRKKDLIISGGRNLHPHDLEAVVSEVPGVHPGRVVAFGMTDEGEGTELIVVLAEADAEDSAGRQAIASEIRRALVRRSDVAASYVDVVAPRWLVKTSSGKIARDANRRKWLAERRLP